MKVNILEAKTRLSELIRSARAGEEVIIANRGQPVARLVPPPATANDAARGSARAILDWLKANPLPAYAQRSPKDIEAAIAAERAAWD